MRSGPRDLLVLVTVVVLCALWAFPFGSGAPDPNEEAFRLYELGNRALRAYEFEQATAYFDQSLALVPDGAPALNDRAWCKLELGQLEEGLADSERAVALAERHDTLHTRACAYIGLGLLDEARADLQRALELRPGFGPAQKCLDYLDEVPEEHWRLVFEMALGTGLPRKAIEKRSSSKILLTPVASPDSSQPAEVQSP